ncbi:MAG TPA: peptidase S9, partial [Rhodothermales bacterium]|nr:peptidase S9 [Rhodothermales bacterium]
MHRLRIALWLGILVATTLALVPDANAQYFGRNKVQYEDFNFQTIKTNHYNIYFYPEEEQAVKDEARMAERWYDKHSATFVHSYDNKPLIFYANDADFQQTNVIEGQIGQGTGGVTEGLMDRVIMPLTGVYAENDHVLGHELVHTFQYDYAQSALGGGLEALSRAPLWLVEGMAEYLSIGHYDPHTAMWMRDAVLQEELPTIEQLSTDTRFFPYRYGEAYMSFIAGHYGGDRAVAELFKRTAAIGLDSAIAEVTGLSADSLSALWARETRDYYTPLMQGRTLPENAGRLVLAKSIDAGDMNIAPALSPDGRYVAFLSSRSLFEIGLYLADARTGEVIRSLTSRGTDPHFDAIRFINSAGTWSPDGRRFAYVVFAEGDNRIEILDVNTRDVDRSIRVQGVGAMQNPAWSPDGRYIAFSGIHG